MGQETEKGQEGQQNQEQQKEREGQEPVSEFIGKVMQLPLSSKAGGATPYTANLPTYPTIFDQEGREVRPSLDEILKNPSAYKLAWAPFDIRPVNVRVRSLLENVLRNPNTSNDAWTAVRPYLSLYVVAHKAEIGELLSRSDDYPQFLLWGVLTILKFDDEQALPIQQFLMKRVIRKAVKVDQKQIHRRRGIVHQRHRDHSALVWDPKYPNQGLVPKPPHTELEGDVYTGLVDSVLSDTRLVMENVLGYLYRTAQNHIKDLLEPSDKRPALLLSSDALQDDDGGEGSAEDGTLEREDNWLSKLATESGEGRRGMSAVRQPGEEAETPPLSTHARDLKSEADAQFEAAEEDADIASLLRKFTRDDRALIGLLLQGIWRQKEVAAKLGVTPARISQRIKQLASHPELRRLAEKVGYKLDTA